MLHIPTHQPLRILAVAIVPRHGRKLLCVATCSESLALMEATIREGSTDYRLSIQDGIMRYHEVRERGVVTRWDRDHAYRPVSERLHEVEAQADAFEPMEEAA